MGHSVFVQNDNYVQHTQEDVDKFNAQPGFENRSLCGSDDVRNDEKRPEVAEYPAHNSPAKMQETGAFAAQRRVSEYPRQDSNL